MAEQLRNAGEVLIGTRKIADVLDPRSLDQFCARCSIVINCAGPVVALRDRVAQAALRNHCHYVDAAGLAIVKEALASHEREIAKAGLSMIISAGWNPGITEALPAYAYAQASAKMESIESLTIYFGDGGEWSQSALNDGAYFIHKTGLRTPGYFHKGDWTRAKRGAMFRKCDLGDSIGSAAGGFVLAMTPELEALGRKCIAGEVSAFVYVSGAKPIVYATLLALFPMPRRWGSALAGGIFRSNNLAPGGFVVAQVRGWSRGKKTIESVRLVFNRDRDYWVHGVAMAAAARIVSEGRARPGANYLLDALDVGQLMSELRAAGIEHSESFAEE